ncbi:DHS-like NAD/FAD-binding domain-containing protein [Ampelomyces quisqualis]|uniref:NAD-dependent protein deacetylase n=1 Tax=Ampelomyces quisqualis TaxID=50730 RepID=A0A6A5QMS9_AMPQU|nr:DHS-like NAD/FAD-binding domain-containing protein [Ampelomyces quisqualis]
MGNEESRVEVDTPPQTLKARTVEALAQYIRDERAKRIVVMTGAGISTSAGIPDFRSPETGLYANLARLNLPYAEAVFDISYFRSNPEPFYTLAEELYPGKYRPTITHSFITLLHRKGLLLKLFTQNIDCLEREAGVPGDLIIEAHGSFATQRCIDCKSPFPADLMRIAMHSNTVPHCLDTSCAGLVKPDIVFFGEQLPSSFFENRDLPATADLAIVMGTSLSVHPFASLPQICAEKTPRLLINSDKVGDMGSRPDDVLLLEDCDSGVRKLAEACGWLDELEALWAETARPDDPPQAEQPQTKKSRDEILQEEVDKLTKDVESTLNLGKSQHEWLENHVDRKIARRQEEEDEKTVEQRENLKPPDDEGEKRMAPAKEEPGLEHVYPHLKKPSP